MNTNKDFTFVILGATGDLAKLKLIPAIYKLLKRNTVSKVTLIGVARSDVTIQSILEEAKKSILATQVGSNIDENIWAKLCEHAHYQQLDFNNPADFEKLHNKIIQVENNDQLSGNRLFYLATLP